MAVHVSHSALPYPIKNVRFSLLTAYVDADGDPTAPVTPDSEISKDNAAAADCAEEVSTTSGMDGVALITLSGAETDCSAIALNFKVASGPKATLITLYPRVLASVGTGTLSAGSAGGGTLGTLLAYDVTGCFIKTTGGTGGGGAGGANNQARKMITYNTGTGAFTVAPNWETTPDATTTYDVLLPEGVTLGMLKTLNPTTAGRTLDVATSGEAEADVTKWTGTAVATPDTAGYPVVTIKDGTGAGELDTASGKVSIATGGITSGSFATDAITASALATDAATEIADAVEAEILRHLSLSTGSSVQSSTAGTIELGMAENSTDDIFNGLQIKIIAGTGKGQTRLITDYDGSTKVATVTPNWTTNPAASDTYAIVPNTNVASQVTTALADIRLDELLSADSDIDGAAPPTVGSVFHELMTKTTGSFTFDQATDSLEAIRDRGDAAWTTGGSSSPHLLQNTTIATLTSQTIFTLTAGSADDDAYAGCVVVVTDSVTSTQKAVGVVLAYLGVTKEITLLNDPGVFTMAAGDTIEIIADRSLKPILDNRTIDVSTMGAVAVADGDTDISLSKALEMLAAFVAGKVSVSSAGGISTYTYKKRDGTTTSFTSLCSETDGTRATTGSLS